ncbi:MAG: hypothetical protein NC078_09955 [Ruminococcus sp.]|nr:hypothetical protein [Ruminococcus sp.]
MNNEVKTPRKDIIKNIAIVFLAVMLVLTFFSNTLMNYSLPQVSAVYTNQGTISEQIRGSGTVEPAQSYEVKVSRKREVESVNVKVNDVVEKGDLLFTFKDEEADDSEITAAETALTEAKNTLATMEFDYRKAVATGSSGSSHEAELKKIENAEGELADLVSQREEVRRGKDPLTEATKREKETKEKADDLNVRKTELTAQLSSVDTEDMIDLQEPYYTRMCQAKEGVETAQKAYDEAKEKYDKAVTDAAASSDYEDSVKEKQKALKTAEAELNALYSQYYGSDPDADMSSAYSAIAMKQAEIESIKMDLSDLAAKSTKNYALQNEVTRTEMTLNKREKALTAAKDFLGDETREIKLELKGMISDVDEDIREAQRAADEAAEDKTNAAAAGYMTEAQLTQKIKEKETEISGLKDAYDAAVAEEVSKNQVTGIDLEKQRYDIEMQKEKVEKAQEKYDKLLKEPAETEVKAQMAGRIASVSVTAGDEPEAGSVAVMIDISDKGYTLEFSVKTEQAKKVKPGDKAEITSWYWGDDFLAELTDIQPDSQNPQTMKKLIFTVSGSDITTGQTISLAMGSKGQSYSAVIPNSAVREDSNGKFVLVMESKPSPLGNRYTAARYDIEVIASDDNNTAVNGLMGSEFVITTSTRPIAAGEQVRPAD